MCTVIEKGCGLLIASRNLEAAKMATAQILDGKRLAAKLRKETASDLRELQTSAPGFQPQLSIVQVLYSTCT